MIWMVTFPLLCVCLSGKNKGIFTEISQTVKYKNAKVYNFYTHFGKLLDFIY